MHMTQNFFGRVGLPADTAIEHTAAFLGELQTACVTHIAYENLDILSGKQLPLDFENVYHKIVTCGRGGYCFELNGFYIHMLRHMGFRVSDRFARFLRGEPTLPMRRHRIAIVSLAEGDYLCDIAVGQVAPRLPLKLEVGLIQHQNGETYRFEKDSVHGWVLMELYESEWRPYISFTDCEQFDIDYAQPHFFCLCHPDSIFNKKLMLSIKTPLGRCTMDGRTYKIFQGTELISMEEHVSDKRLLELFQEKFMLNTDGLKQELIHF